MGRFKTRIFIVAFGILCFLPVSVTDCNAKLFGRSCQYACNCAGTCDTTSGNCTGGCERGWEGPTCQKQNIALRKQTAQASIYKANTNSSNAVDGNRNGEYQGNGTCIHTQAPTRNSKEWDSTWWRVNLGSAAVSVKSVRIYDRTDGYDKQRIAGYKIYVANNTDPPTNDDRCYTRYVPLQKEDRIYNQTCTATGQYLTIFLRKLNAILDFCEVEVYNCSSGTYGNDCEKQCGYCDNNDTCNQNDGSCPNGCAAGWNGTTCEQACDHGKYGKNCEMTCGKCSTNDTCNPSTGTCTNGCQPGFNGDLCETKCQNRTYGMNCHDDCGHCLNNTVCDTITGKCDKGCDPGYRTDKCDQTCVNHKYGAGCGRKCGKCEGDVRCSHVTGICDQGCAPGYYPTLCQDECTNQTYGINCSEKCGMCDHNSQCSHQSGICEDGCTEGYFGGQCKTLCRQGWYGKNCSSACGNCINGKFCDKTTGICENGCKAGYQTELCNAECNIGFYGLNCNKTCHNCVNNTCRHTDGICDTCTSGWQGSMCTQELSQTETPATGPIIGAVLAVIVVIIAIGIIIFVKKRRQPSPRKKTRTMKDVNKANTINHSTEDFDETRGDRLYVNDVRSPLSRPIDNDRNRLNMETTYTNIQNMDKGILLHKLKNYVEQKTRSEELESEFREIPKGPRFQCLEGEKNINKEKNRFKTTFPYDHSRVVLPIIPGQHNSDYINANYIDGITKKSVYIATQGPKMNTVSDFWRMVWTQNSGKIVMLTGLVEGNKVKCEKYWPDIDEPITAYNLQISFIEEQEHSVYVVRRVQITDNKNRETRTVFQYHFTKWPDHGVPDQFQLLTFHRHVLGDYNTLKGPIVVHCSAGVGRTGTFIGLDALLENGVQTKKVDVRGFVEKMRNNRVDMIQTEKQYIFLYQVLVEAFADLNPSVSKDKFVAEKLGRNIDFPSKEFETLIRMKDNYITDDFKHASSRENANKNRSKNILPVNAYRPYLSSYVAGRNDYINAVIVPDSCIKYGFMATQLPFDHTMCDFWRLVLDHDSLNIVCLENPSKDGKPYWPTNGEELSFDSRLFVSLSTKPRRENGITIYQCLLKYKGASEIKRNVTIYELPSSSWLDGEATPKDLSPLLCLEDIVYKIQTSDSSSVITIQCLNGALRCGLAIAIFNAIQRIRMDGDVNIYHTVRQIQIHRPQFVNTEKQYRYCYEAIKDYLNISCIYANM